jgi:hypothetical protein
MTWLLTFVGGEGQQRRAHQLGEALRFRTGTEEASHIGGGSGVLPTQRQTLFQMSKVKRLKRDQIQLTLKRNRRREDSEKAAGIQVMPGWVLGS